MSYAVQPIGIIRSPYKNREEAPRQGVDREEVSTLLFHDKKHVLKLGNSKRLRLLYWMHLADREVQRSRKKKKGVFATRSPDRPNPIGTAVVEVIKTQDEKVLVRHLDALDGTPLLRAIPL